VTGSAGFIGRHLVRALAARGDEVSGLDRSAGDPEIAHHTVVADLLEAPGLIDRFRQIAPEALVHLAARTDLDGSSLEDYAANTLGVSNIISSIRRTPSLKRALFTSSQLVCRPGYIPAHPTDYQPSTLYGESKVRTEQIVREQDGGGVSWCLVRPTTVWGPGMRAHYQRFLALIERGRYFHVGQRPVRKTYGFIGNVVAQYLSLLDAEPRKIQRKTLYLGDYQPISLRGWADGFQRALGAVPIRTLPRWLARFAARGGDVINTLGWRAFPFNSFRLGNVLTESVYDLKETEAICGPLPYSMEAGIEETVRWYRRRPNNRASG